MRAIAVIALIAWSGALCVWGAEFQLADGSTVSFPDRVLMQLSSQTAAQLEAAVENLLPVTEELTPLEQYYSNLIEHEEFEGQALLEGQALMELGAVAEMEAEAEAAVEADADADSTVMDTSALEAENDAEQDAEAEMELEFGPDDEDMSSFLEVAESAAGAFDLEDENEALAAVVPGADLDPLVSEFITNHARHSVADELRALEDGVLTFDKSGNDVLLENAALGSAVDADVDAALRARIHQKWQAEKYYSNPHAKFTATDDLEQQPSMVEMHAEAEAEAQSGVEAHETVDAEAEAAIQAVMDHAAHVKAHEQAQAQAEAEAKAAAEQERRDQALLMELSARAAHTTSFTPQQAEEHKVGQIGKMRSRRLRATRQRNHHMVRPQVGGRHASNPANYGTYDERRAAVEGKPLNAKLQQALEAERTQRRGSGRAAGIPAARFCATFPYCGQTPPPLGMAALPPLEDAARAKAEAALRDPLRHLPTKLADLQRDPKRFGTVFQHIYAANAHNERQAGQKHGRT